MRINEVFFRLFRRDFACHLGCLSFLVRLHLLRRPWRRCFFFRLVRFFFRLVRFFFRLVRFFALVRAGYFFVPAPLFSSCKEGQCILLLAVRGVAGRERPLYICFPRTSCEPTFPSVLSSLVLTTRKNSMSLSSWLMPALTTPS